MQAFTLRKMGWWPVRCGMHANHALLFSAAGAQDGLTKTKQMNQAGLQSPQSKLAAMKTTFFLTKSQCSHDGDALCHDAVSHFCPRSVVLLSTPSLCSFFSLCTHSSAMASYLCLTEHLHTFHPTHIFVTEFWEI